jgi:hypothetical protein
MEAVSGMKLIKEKGFTGELTCPGVTGRASTWTQVERKLR